MSQSQELVKKWYDRAAFSQHTHYRSADHYRRATYLLGVPVIVLTAVVGTSVFASLSQNPSEAGKLVIGGASILATVLASLQTFLGYSDRSEKHRLAGAKYGALSRELEYALAMPDANTDLTELRKRLDAVAIESPSVPLFIARKALRDEPSNFKAVASQSEQPGR